MNFLNIRLMPCHAFACHACDFERTMTKTTSWPSGESLPRRPEMKKRSSIVAQALSILRPRFGFLVARVHGILSGALWQKDGLPVLKGVYHENSH